jgi:predicted permease
MWVWLQSVRCDLRYAVRSLRHDPVFSLGAVGTLSLGVGLVATLFAIANGLLLKPWPLPNPDQVVVSGRGVSPTAFRYLRDSVRSVELAAFAQACSTTIEDELENSPVRCVSGNYFDVLGVPLLLGRGFRTDEDLPTAPTAVAVIGFGLWQTSFASSTALGRTIRLNGRTFEIVGVAAAGARDRAEPNRPRLWVPLAAYPLLARDSEFTRGFLFNPEYCCVTLTGRLREPGTHATATAELTTLYLQFRGDPREPAVTITGTREILQAWHRSGVAIIGITLTGVVLVLLVACGNVGNLLLARGLRRRTEFAVRASLGASRGRLVRQFITEAAVLAGAAAAVSLAMSSLLVAALARAMDGSLGREAGIDLSPDWRVAAVALCIALVAVVTLAVGPVMSATRRLALARSGDYVPVGARFRLLILQVALSAALIVVAAMLGRALHQARLLDPGFDAAGVSRVTIRLPVGATADQRRSAVINALRDGLRADGSAATAGAGITLFKRVTVNGDESRLLGPVQARLVSAEYLRLLAVPLLEGRMFAEADGSNVVLVNETFARRGWPGRSAVGGLVIAADADARAGSMPTAIADAAAGGIRRVVGVVGDMQPTRPGEAVQPTLFVRGSGDALYIRNLAPVVDRARALARTIEPAAGLDFQPLSAARELGLQGIRAATVLSWTLGLIALAIAVAGVFGVFALVAEERRREVGIRIALGAGTRAVILLMLSYAGRALVSGLAVGLGAGLGLAQILRSNLAGLVRNDAMAFAGAAVLLGAATILAVWLPIRRALRIDPAMAIRAD